MSNPLGVSQDSVDAANRALGIFITNEPDFYNTKTNCRMLIDYLKGKPLKNDSGQVLQGDPIPLELQSHENIWIVAFTHCRRHGLLEVPPPPETPEARNRRLAAKDRYDGYAGNKDTDPTTVLERQAKERRDRIAAEKKAAEESAKAAAAKAAADADLSGIPTVAQIVAGEAKPFGELSAKEIHAMSSAQLKRYTQNSHSALIEKENVRVAEKRARIKERANA